MAHCLKVESVDQFDDINRDLGYDIEYRQLSRKAFHATMLSEQRDGYLFTREWMTGPVEVYFAEPENYCSILCAFADGEVLFNGVRAHDGVAFLLAPGHENRLISNRNVGARVLRIPLGVAEGVARKYGIDWSSRMQRGFQAINLGGQTLRRFESDIDSVLGSARNGSHPDLSDSGGVLPAILKEQATSAELSTSMRDALFARAVSFVDTKLPDEIGVQDLSDELQMSIRSVQRLFSQVLGITPTHYIENRRLNMVRRRLLGANSSSPKVSQVALDMGFRHLGRFSNAYRVLFGECPRDTLHRD